MKNKIVVTGGTGLIGKELIALLKTDNYYIVNISRNIEKSKTILPLVDKHINWSNENWENIFEDSYAIINLSGSSVAGGLWSGKYKKSIYDSRINGTKQIVDTLNNLSNPPKVLINASAVGYYKEQSDKTITEEAKSGEDFLANVCIDWENEALKAEHKCRVVLARTGLVLDKNQGALAKMLYPYKYYLGGPLGSGKQFMPWIHISDMINLYKWVLENENISGAINFCSPNPVTMNEFSKTLGEILKKPSFFRVPSIVLKTLLGESSDLILKGQKAIPKKAIENGFEFKFNRLNEALTDLLTDKQ